MNTNKLKKTIIILSKIFLIGLLLQFFLQTFFTYELNFQGTLWNIVWMRKEIVLIGLLGILIYNIQKNKFGKQIREKLPIKGFIIFFFILLLYIGITSLFITKVGISAYLISIRYSMIGFFIFILFFVLKYLETEKGDIDVIKRYSDNIIKKILRGALIWWGLIWLAPNLLDHLGYDQYNVEGKIGIAPPAAYYTQYNEGYVRNQFIFERPISLGFFLVAFWPVFFFFVLKNRGRKNILFWGGLFGVIIFSTFSRAARIAFFIQTGILIFLEYKKHFRKILLYGGLPLLITIVSIAYLGKDKLLERNYSDIGHFKMISQAIQKIQEKPLWGQGAGSAGPASYQLQKEGYNPENQFLQIWIEYGALAFIGWMILYLYLHKIGITAFKASDTIKKSKQERFFGYIVFAFSLGLLGLSIEGMVLHSFVDRMIVYPFMALFGIAYAVYCKNKDIN